MYIHMHIYPPIVITPHYLSLNNWFHPHMCFRNPSNPQILAPTPLGGAILSVPITCVFRLWLSEFDDRRAQRLHRSLAEGTDMGMDGHGDMVV